MEIEHLKSNKEELNNSLKEANQTLEELLKTKVRKKCTSIANYMRPKAPGSQIKVGLGASAPELWLDLVLLMRL